MHCLTVIYPRPDDPEHFKKYYKETHIPLAKQLPGLKSCALRLSGSDRSRRQRAVLHLPGLVRVSRRDGTGDAIGHRQEGRSRRAELFAQGRNHLPFRAGTMTSAGPNVQSHHRRQVRPHQGSFRGPQSLDRRGRRPRAEGDVRPTSTTPSTRRRPRSRPGRRPRRTSARSSATRWRRSLPTMPKRSRA